MSKGRDNANASTEFLDCVNMHWINLCNALMWMHFDLKKMSAFFFKTGSLSASSWQTPSNFCYSLKESYTLSLLLCSRLLQTSVALLKSLMLTCLFFLFLSLHSSCFSLRESYAKSLISAALSKSLTESEL